jgi:hypothetical protein
VVHLGVLTIALRDVWESSAGPYGSSGFTLVEPVGFGSLGTWVLRFASPVN